MASTYEPIATNTLSSSASSVTFSSISGSYTDIVLIISATVTSGSDDIAIRFNSDTGSNYSITALSGSGSTAYSNRQSSQTKALLDYYGSISTTLSNRIVNLQNYSNTTTYKTFVARASASANGIDAIVGLWRSTSAITTIDLINSGGSSFASGSTFTLYGIKAA